MNGVHLNGHGKNTKDFSDENGLEDIKQDIYGISDYSTRLEKILFSLLKQHDSLKNKLEDFASQSSLKEKELEKKIDNNFLKLFDDLEKEKEERKSEGQQIKDNLKEELASNGDDLRDLQDRLKEEIRNREVENKKLDDKFTQDVDICKEETQKINDILNAENERFSS